MTWNTQGIKGIQWSGVDRHEDYVDYLDRYADIKAGADRWLSDQSNTHWANYVRQRGGLFTDFQNRTTPGKGLLGGQSMWDYGAWHANEFGYKTNRDNWKVLGSGDMPRNQMAIGDDIYDFAKWHWETQGQKAGRTLRDMDDVRAQQAADDLKAWQAEQAAIAQEAATKAAEQAEAGRLASQRGSASYTQGATGNATFKGSGADASKNRRGKRGTGQFKRAISASPLSIAAGTGQKQGTSGLNIAQQA